MVKFISLYLAFTLSLFSADINHSLKIDEIISADLKYKKLSMPKKSSDDVFVRRAFLDIVGRIPTYEESIEFKKYNDREELVNYLINSQGYNESMFNFFADNLRLKKKLNGNVSGETYITWVRDQIKKNTPYNKLVKDILTAQGTIYTNPAVGYFLRDEGMLLDNVSNTFQAFAGMDVSCAQCHDHPFDDWSQMEYYEMSAFFTTVNTRSDKGMRKEYQRLRKEAEATDKAKETKGALNEIGQFWQQGGYRNKVDSDLKKVLSLPHDYKYKDGDPGEVVKAVTPVGDRVKETRKRNKLQPSFAQWMISEEHPTFTANIVNRLWHKAFGFALIDNLNNIAEYDELRESRNDKLLLYLIDIMKEVNYDLKKFNSILYNTKFYGCETDPEDNFQGPIMRRMTAAQLWDSIITLYTGDIDKWQPENRIEKFRYMFPEDLATLNSTQALKIYKDFKKVEKEYYKGAPKAGKVFAIRSSHIFDGRARNFMLEFGGSDRELIENGNQEANIMQILTLMNSGMTKELMSVESRLGQKLLDLKRKEAVDYVFRSYIGRSPSKEEQQAFKGVGFSDIVWVLINSHEFKLII